MSRGLQTKFVPLWVAQGIEAAFREWEEMSGEWLWTAPEYFSTVKVAQHLRKVIPASQRTLLMEPQVGQVLESAGGVQCGRKAAHLRVDGRLDIVLGHGNGTPRVVIELKNGSYLRMGDGVRADLHRLCQALLHGKHHTQLHAGVLGLFTSTRPPRTKRDATARAYLERRWLLEYRPMLQSWRWAREKRAQYARNLRIEVGLRIHEREHDGETHAWAVVVVRINRKPRAIRAKEAASAHKALGAV